MIEGQGNNPLDYKQPASPTGRRPNRNKRLVIGAVLLAVLVPALILPTICSSMYAQLHRVHCATSMRQIGYALQAYARDHGGHLPDKLGTLLTTEGISAFDFVCEASGQQTSTAQSPEAIADDINAGRHVSFIYLGAGLTDAVPGDTVVLYEPLKNHGNGINIVHADASVEWLDRKEATAFLNQVASAPRPVRYPATYPAAGAR